MEKDNLIRLSDYRSEGMPVDFGDQTSPRILKLNFPFIIEALKPEDAFCMSVELHELSNRYAFLTYDSLESETFSNQKLFLALGSISILIDDIESISLGQQEHIAERIRMSKNQTGPQFILATTDSLSILKQSLRVSQNLLDELCVAFLHMDQSFSYYKKKDLKKFFAESIQSSIHLP